MSVGSNNCMLSGGAHSAVLRTVKNAHCHRCQNDAKHFEGMYSDIPPSEDESAAASWKVLTGPFTVPVRDPNSVSGDPEPAAPAWVSHTDFISTWLLGATMSPAHNKTGLV